MTETEIAFAAMTLDELREAGEYIDNARRFFKASRTIEFGQVASTEGPQLALDGLVLAWFREVHLRYGGTEWFAGMALEGHEQAKLVALLLERMTLVPESERRIKARGIDIADIRRRTCATCGGRFAATTEHFELVDGNLTVTCRTCVEALGRRQVETDAWGDEAAAAGVPEEEQRILARQIIDGLGADDSLVLAGQSSGEADRGQ